MDGGRLRQYIVGIVVSLTFAAAGMVYGWSAPIIVRLQSNSSHIQMTPNEAGYVVTAVEFGNVLSALPAGLIADRIGRKPVILSIVPLYIISWSLIIYTRSVEFLILARIFGGMSMGIIYTVCPLYLGEIADPEIRGKITSFAVVLWCFGILTSYCIGPYVSYDCLSYISVLIPAMTTFGLMFIPESPYYLTLRGKYGQAKNELKKVRSGGQSSIEKEMISIKTAISEITAGKVSSATLITDPACRMSLYLVFLLGFIAFFGGVTVMFAYATDIFQTVGGIPLNADQCTIILGFLFFLLAIITTGIVDVCGRRILFLISAGGSAICHFIGGLYFYLQNYTSFDVTSQGWILLLAVGGYCFFFSIGMSPVLPVYQGEIFADGVKGIASGLVVIQQGVSSMVVLKLFQVVNLHFGKHISFWFFCVINTIGFILTYFYLIETKGKTLAEIQKELKTQVSKNHTETRSMETVPFKSRT